MHPMFSPLLDKLEAALIDIDTELKLPAAASRIAQKSDDEFSLISISTGMLKSMFSMMNPWSSSGAASADRIDVSRVNPAELHKQRRELEAAVNNYKALAEIAAGVLVGDRTEANAFLADLLRKATALKVGLESSRESSVAKRFPMAQLNDLIRAAQAEQTALNGTGSRSSSSSSPSPSSVTRAPEVVAEKPRPVVVHKPMPLVRLSALTTAADAIGAIVERLGAKSVGDALTTWLAAIPAAEKARATSLLAATAQLVDQGIYAPNYKESRTGGFNPTTRAQYRARAYGQQVWSKMSERIEATREQFKSDLKAVAGGKDGVAGLEKLLVSGFLREIGLESEKKLTAKWNVTADAVAQALAHEVLTPLRCMNECTEDYTARAGYGRGKYDLDDVQSVIREITQHVCEGDFTAWRHANADKTSQLAHLSPRNLAKWYDTSSSVKIAVDGGGFVSTREVDGLDLFWSTKIAGPSHGFDQSHPWCVLGLLSDPRNHIIEADAPGHASGAARAHFRCIESVGADGVRSPVLFLEDIYTDHGCGAAPREFTYDGPEHILRAAVVKHAVNRTFAMKDVALSVTGNAAGAMRGLPPAANRSYYLAPAVLLTASDGLLGYKHDVPQMDPLKTDPLNRIHISPEA